MRKIAIFVEGMTEQEFVIAMITALAGAKGLHFELAEQFGGKVAITHSTMEDGVRFYVLVVDCHGDNQVKTQIREQYSSLVAAGYTSIIGLRDVFPMTKADVPKLLRLLSIGMPVGPVGASIHLAVMEIEAWFIAEVSHFERLCPSLNHNARLANGFDTTQSPEDWDHPAAALDSIYRLAGKAYMSPAGLKKRARVQRTLRTLSFDEMYVNVGTRVPALNLFVTEVENALF